MNRGTVLLSNRVQDRDTQVLLITNTLNERTQRPAAKKRRTLSEYDAFRCHKVNIYNNVYYLTDDLCVSTGGMKHQNIVPHMVFNGGGEHSALFYIQLFG